MEELKLDLENIKDKIELHNYLKKELGLPDYYGYNLDALHDCMTEQKKYRCIKVYYFDSLKKELGEYADTLLQVFRDAGIVVEIL
ncbi:MAG: barstar family protein [Bacteroidales bacterium]|nr:barstar family protein [Clostridium sp.]MCM1203083.1 barstar family protein [Bacteroidales bacterium]